MSALDLLIVAASIIPIAVIVYNNEMWTRENKRQTRLVVEKIKTANDLWRRINRETAKLTEWHHDLIRREKALKEEKEQFDKRNEKKGWH